MKALFCAIISCLATVGLSQHCPPDIEWQRTLGISEDPVITIVEIMSDGGYFLAVAGDETQGLVRTDAEGNVLWFRRINYPVVTPFVETEDGGVIFGSHHFVVRLDSTVTSSRSPGSPAATGW
jgi:hypothetical protein